MGLEEALEEPGFYILAGLGVLMEVIGFIAAKKIGNPWSIWMFLVLVVVTIIASAFFSIRD